MATNEAVKLAEATLSTNDKKKGWRVGFSDREELAYFYNASSGQTQWQSPSTGVKTTDPGPQQEPPRLEQLPVLPKNMPAHLNPPPTPAAHPYTKDVFAFPEKSGVDAADSQWSLDVEVGSADEMTGGEVSRTDIKQKVLKRRPTELKLPCATKKSKVDLDQDYEFPAGTHPHPLGGVECERYRELLTVFVMLELYAQIEILTLPTIFECEGCENNWPDTMHACINFGMSLHQNQERVNEHFTRARKFVEKNVKQSEDLFNKWNIFLKHTSIEMEKDKKRITESKVFSDCVTDVLRRFSQGDREYFFDTFDNLYLNIGMKSVTFQHVVDFYCLRLPPQRWEDTFDGEYYYYCKKRLKL